MKSYPRIFTVSTVDIVKHTSIDYLIHPFRTDFTGDSGTGKSLLVADLIQLIFVAKGSIWKTTTREQTSEIRTIEGMVKPKCKFGYAFLNIEINQNQFVVIGSYIRTTTKTSQSFIVQAEGGDWSENGLKAFSKPLSYQDFLNEKKQTLPIEELKVNFYDNNRLLLKTFDAEQYHTLLYSNHLLHINLAKDEQEKTLKAYATILQSFAKGGSVELNKREQLKSFLFQAEDNLGNQYSTQKKQIIIAQNAYIDNKRIRTITAHKQEDFLDLVKKLQLRDDAHKKALIDDILYIKQNLETKTKEVRAAKIELAALEIEHYIIEQRINAAKEETYEIEKKEANDSIQRLKVGIESAKQDLTYATKREDYLQNEVESTQHIFDELKTQKDKFDTVQGWVANFQTIDKVLQKFEQQGKNEQQQASLSKFETWLNSTFTDNEKTKPILNDFIDSEWSKLPYTTAYSNYTKKQQRLTQEIANLENIKPLFDKTSQNSFAHWAIKANKSFTPAQEAIIWHFAAKKVTSGFAQDDRYIYDANLLLNTRIEPIENGFWLYLNGIAEYIPAPEKYLFQDYQTLNTTLQELGTEINSKLETLQVEQNKSENLFKRLQEFGFNTEYSNFYQNKAEIQSFTIYEPFKKYTIETLNEAIEVHKITNAATIKDDYNTAMESRNTALKKQTKNDQDKTTAQTTINTTTPKIDEENAKIKKADEEIRKIAIEKAAIEVSLNTQKVAYTNIENPEKYEALCTQLNLKYKSENDALSLSKIQTMIANKKATPTATISTNENAIPSLNKKYEETITDYEKIFDKFVLPELIPILSKENVEQSKENYRTKNTKYELKYVNIIKDENYRQERSNSKNIEEYKNKYDFLNLIADFVTFIRLDGGIEDIEKQLQESFDAEIRRLNEEIETQSRNQLKHFKTVFGAVLESAKEMIDKVDNLNNFFEKYELTDGKIVQIQPLEDPNYPLNWLDILAKNFEKEAANEGFFKIERNISPDEIVYSTYLQVTGKDRLEIQPSTLVNRLLNPLSYFQLELKILDKKTKAEVTNSGGQGYGLVALVCIAKLSLIEEEKSLGNKQKQPKGLRYMPIDEVAQLGTNFEMLRKIAQDYDYQILTMNPKSNDLEFINGEQFVYTLIKNNNDTFKDSNPPPIATFSGLNLIDNYKEYIAEHGGLQSVLDIINPPT